VEVTRALGIQFLWIDSLCIIQDDPEDWERESKRMEKVFASAYCTIAATSAKNSSEGFLRRKPVQKHECLLDGQTVDESDTHTHNVAKAYGLHSAPSRPAPQCVRLSDRNTDNEFHIYATTSSENFGQDVEEGILNSRAWVYQERALSRRTIHFAKSQTYWECGSIIRSECLNDWSEQLNWLGDSNFPQAASRLDPKVSDSMFEHICTQYSSLDITNLEDRPVAIQGLETRLAMFYNTETAYGIFQCFLARSLFWQRDGDTPMQPIKFRNRKVPSWSWMAYSGKIRYGRKGWFSKIYFSEELKLDLRNHRITAPLAGSLNGCHIRPDLYHSDCRLESTSDKLIGWLRFDQCGTHDAGELRCVAIARDRTANGWREYAKVPSSWDLGLSRDFVLVVTKREKEDAYRRVGVGVVVSNLLSKTKVPRVSIT
jgi:hypothetical protein